MTQLITKKGKELQGELDHILGVLLAYLYGVPRISMKSLLAHISQMAEAHRILSNLVFIIDDVIDREGDYNERP